MAFTNSALFASSLTLHRSKISDSEFALPPHLSPYEPSKLLPFPTICSQHADTFSRKMYECSLLIYFSFGFSFLFCLVAKKMVDKKAGDLCLCVCDLRFWIQQYLTFSSSFYYSSCKYLFIHCCFVWLLSKLWQLIEMDHPFDRREN